MAETNNTTAPSEWQDSREVTAARMRLVNAIDAARADISLANVTAVDDAWNAYDAAVRADTPSAAGAGEAVPDAYLPVDSDGRCYWPQIRATEHDARLAVGRLPGYDGFAFVLRPLYAHPPAHPVVTEAMVEVLARRSAGCSGYHWTTIDDDDKASFLDEARKDLTAALTATRGSDADS